MAFFQGDVPGIFQFSRQAIEQLPKQDLQWRSIATLALGDAHFVKGEIDKAYRVQREGVETSQAIGCNYMTLCANLKLAITAREQGRLDQVVEICKQQTQFADENGLSQTPAGGWSLAIWGEVLAEKGDLDRASLQARKGVDLTRSGGDVGILASSYLYLTRALFTSGNLTGAQEAIQEIEHIARETDVPPWMMILVAVWQARVWLAQGNLDAATQWMQDRGQGVAKDPTLLHEMEYGIVSARILIAQGRLDEGTSYLLRLLRAAEAGGRTTRAIEILALQGLAYQAAGDATRAIDALERALSLAEPKGFFRIFVDEGPPMARLLLQALRFGIRPGYIRRLLAAFPDVEPEETASARAPAPSSELIEPLSDREIEVLQLIAEGLTNRDIAARLYLSPHTIKVHTRNLYGKLSVHNRVAAVARGRALCILLST